MAIICRNGYGVLDSKAPRGWRRSADDQSQHQLETIHYIRPMLESVMHKTHRVAVELKTAMIIQTMK